jgi:hypothetical protein
MKSTFFKLANSYIDLIQKSQKKEDWRINSLLSLTFMMTINLLTLIVLINPLDDIVNFTHSLKIDISLNLLLIILIPLLLNYYLIYKMDSTTRLSYSMFKKPKLIVGLHVIKGIVLFNVVVYIQWLGS